MLNRNYTTRLVLLVVNSCLFLGLPPIIAQQPAPVDAIAPSANPLPPESLSRGVYRFSFIVYGDTRGRRDGTEIQYEHSLVVDSMIGNIKRLQNTQYPVRFVLQSGDCVFDGTDARQWNVSFIPIINRLTREAGVPYFSVPGNHDVTESTTGNNWRDRGVRNFLHVMSAFIPADGSPRRLSGYPTYSFGYGNTFVIGLDGNIANDEKQYEWVKQQLEGLDRARYTVVIVFCHQAMFSSGEHGGINAEPGDLAFRSLYLTLFEHYHVRVVFSGHDHVFEHYVERYRDSSGPHRLDFIVSAGGGAPIYAYTGEPALPKGYAYSGWEFAETYRAVIEHIVKPGVDRGSNPYHYLIVRVDRDNLQLEVVGVDWGADFAPYRSNRVELRDP